MGSRLGLSVVLNDCNRWLQQSSGVNFYLGAPYRYGGVENWHFLAKSSVIFGGSWTVLNRFKKPSPFSAFSNVMSLP